MTCQHGSCIEILRVVAQKWSSVCLTWFLQAPCQQLTKRIYCGDSHNPFCLLFSCISLWWDHSLSPVGVFVNGTLNRAKFTNKQNNRPNKNKNHKNSNIKNKPYIVVPYMKGLSESCRNICRKHGIEMFFKGANTIRELLVHPKDKDNILKKSGVIYRYKCGRVGCEDEYIGESGRTFAERFREYIKSPSPIHDHFNTTGQDVSLDNFSIVGREDQSMTRTIREAMLIRVNDPSLNRNIGKYQLSYIWDESLVKSTELKLNR